MKKRDWIQLKQFNSSVSWFDSNKFLFWLILTLQVHCIAFRSMLFKEKKKKERKKSNLSIRLSTCQIVWCIMISRTFKSIHNWRTKRKIRAKCKILIFIFPNLNHFKISIFMKNFERNFFTKIFCFEG